MKRTQQLVLALLLTMVSGSVYSAGACTYREAIMALEQGNMVRGMTLMRMAHHDGDERASSFLAGKNIAVSSQPDTTGEQDEQLVSLDQVISE